MYRNDPIPTAPDRNKKLIMLVAAGLVKVGMDKKSLAIRLHMSEPTLYRRFADPGTFTLKEVRKLASVLKIDSKDLFDAIY